jgi:hypothetical protein
MAVQTISLTDRKGGYREGQAQPMGCLAAFMNRLGSGRLIFPCGMAVHVISG